MKIFIEHDEKQENINVFTLANTIVEFLKERNSELYTFDYKFPSTPKTTYPYIDLGELAQILLVVSKNDKGLELLLDYVEREFIKDKERK